MNPPTLKIVQLGHPVLRQKARPLSREEILGREIQELIALMRETMRDAPGVGLAAPQIGLPYQLAVIEDQPSYSEDLDEEALARRERVAVPFHVIINPVLTPSDARGVEAFEGCLSFDGFVGLVSRARKVKVECLNEKAEPTHIEASGWYARILQHEIDHLHGTIYVDRVETRTLARNENFGRFWQDASVAEVKQALGVGDAPRRHEGQGKSPRR